MKWPASCDDLISSFILDLLCLISSFLQKQKTHRQFNCFQVIAIFINTSDITCGLYLAIICAANIFYKGRFAVKELIWRRHIMCFTASGIFIFFQTSSLVVMLFLTFSRLRAVQNPFKTHFRRTEFVLNFLALIYALLLVVSFGAIFLTKISFHDYILPNGLCNIFYDPIKSTLSNSFVLVLTSCQLGTNIVMLIMYLFLIHRINRQKMPCMILLKGKPKICITK